MSQSTWEGSSEYRRRRDDGDPHLKPPLPQSPIYDLSDPRQWFTIALDKGFAVVVALYVLIRLEAVLSQVRDTALTQSQQLAHITAILERTPR